MSWVSLILGLVKLASSLTQYVSERQLMQAGQDKEIAKATLKLLEVTETGKALRAKVAQMDDEDAEKLWKDMVS